MSQREHQYELLSAYLDGELTPPQARNLEEAMADEPALRAELERLKLARDAVRTLPSQAAPAALAERVLGQIERGCVLESTASPAGRRSHWTYYLSAAAAAVVLAGLGLAAYLLLHQPSYLDKQLLAQKEAPAEGAKRTTGAAWPQSQPDLAAKSRGDRGPQPGEKDEAGEASPGLVGPVLPAQSRPVELAKAEEREHQQMLASDVLAASRPASSAQELAATPAAAAYRLRSAASTGPEISAKLTPQGPPLYEPDPADKGGGKAMPALAAAPAPAPAAKVAGMSRGMAGPAQASRPMMTLPDARPAVYFDLAVPDLRLVIRVRDLAAAQEHMREVLEVAEQAHVAAEAADLGGAMCVSFNGRIVRQEGAIQYEFRIHPRAMPLLVRALTEMASLEQSWQVLQSPRPLESKWQVLRECLGEALAASQPVRDRVVISRQELPTTRGAADSIEMFNTFSLVASSAATATAPVAPASAPATTRPAQQWVEPYNLIVRIEAAPADSAATAAAPATSSPTATSHPAQ